MSEQGIVPMESTGVKDLESNSSSTSKLPTTELPQLEFLETPPILNTPVPLPAHPQLDTSTLIYPFDILLTSWGLIRRLCIWLSGPSPPEVLTIETPFPFPALQRKLKINTTTVFIYLDSIISLRSLFLLLALPFRIKIGKVDIATKKWKPLLRWIFLGCWIVVFAVFVKQSSFGNSGVTWIGCTDAYWAMNDDCGLNGTLCEPFSNSSLSYRCPASCKSVTLLNPRSVGAQVINYKPFLIGGGDSQGTYRSDSWICEASLQQGLYSDKRGGCGVVELVGEFENYKGFKGGEGLESVGFDTQFVSSFRVSGRPQGQNGCRDFRWEILSMNIILSIIWSMVFEPPRFWHISMVSDAQSVPPDVSAAFGIFLPGMFVAYGMWRSAWRWTLPGFYDSNLEKKGMGTERSLWYLTGFWVGTLINVTASWIPIDRLTPHDIKQRPGGLLAVIILAIVGSFFVIVQCISIWKTGWLFKYLQWYITAIAVIGILCATPNEEFRFHHYFAGIVLTPGTGFKTRLSALLQAFLFGMYLNGIARWNFDSIYETPASLVGDGLLGTQIPSFVTNSNNFNNTTLIQWAPIPENLTSQWDSFSLLIDDVERYSGDSLNFSLVGNGLDLDMSLPHYFRIAYVGPDGTGDFTMAATGDWSNGTWRDPEAGST